MTRINKSGVFIRAIRGFGPVLGLLIVIPVGVTLVVAWPVILIAAMIVVLSKGTDAWRRPPTSPPRGLTNDFAEGGWRIDRENGLLNGQ